MLDCTGSPMVFAETLAAARCWSGGVVEIAWSGMCYLWDPCVKCEGWRGVEVAVAKGCQCGRGCTHVRGQTVPRIMPRLSPTSSCLPASVNFAGPTRRAVQVGFSARRPQTRATTPRNSKTGVSGLTRMRWHDRDKLPRALSAGLVLCALSMGWRGTRSFCVCRVRANGRPISHQEPSPCARRAAGNLTAGASRVRRAELPGRDPGQGQR